MTNLVFVFEDRPLPSTDFYIIPALKANGYEIRRCHSDNLPEAKELKGHKVVIVRYLSSRLKKLIELSRGDLVGLVYFMDDDLLDINAARGMPLKFQLRLYWQIWRHRSWLYAQKPVYWVSTSFLQKKYQSINPKLVLQSPLKLDQPERIRVFYHGTPSHEKEFRWLKPVIHRVVTQNQQIVFEVFGDARIKKMYSEVPGVHIIHPLRWPDYQSFVNSFPQHIGLAPQLECAYNRARSYTKFLDITRSGAVGVFAQGTASAEVVDHDVDGLVLPMEPDMWVDAILDLARDEKRLNAMYKNALKKYQQQSEIAAQSYLKLF